MARSEFLHSPPSMETSFPSLTHLHNLGNPIGIVKSLSYADHFTQHPFLPNNILPRSPGRRADALSTCSQDDSDTIDDILHTLWPRLPTPTSPTALNCDSFPFNPHQNDISNPLIQPRQPQWQLERNLAAAAPPPSQSQKPGRSNTYPPLGLSSLGNFSKPTDSPIRRSRSLALNDLATHAVARRCLTGNIDPNTIPSFPAHYMTSNDFTHRKPLMNNHPSMQSSSPLQYPGPLGLQAKSEAHSNTTPASNPNNPHYRGMLSSLPDNSSTTQSKARSASLSYALYLQSSRKGSFGPRPAPPLPNLH